MELFRITKNDGKIYLINYLPKINDYLIFYKNNNFSNQWLKLIDRNRSKENKHILTKEDWYLLFSESGFEVKKYIPTINQTYAHIWNVGLRPLAGYILELAQKLNKNEYYEFKKKWVNTLSIVLEPYLSNDFFRSVPEDEEVEAIFVLQKK